MRITKSQLGLAAVVILAPGGFLIGATWLAARYRQRHLEAQSAVEAQAQAEIADSVAPAEPIGRIVS